MRVAGGRVFMGDVPLDVVGVDSIDDAQSVVPSQPASGANGLPSYQVAEATTRSFVEGAPVA